MARQISFDDIIPSEFKQRVVGFVSEQFKLREDASDLPRIKNNHEAYGVLAEAFVLVQGSIGAVKSAVGDALSALPASGEAFNEASDIAYSACVSAAQAAINMAIHAQNICLQFIERRRDEPLPLLEGLDGEELQAIPEDDENDNETEDNENG